MRVPPALYRWLMDEQGPRETLGQTLERLLQPIFPTQEPAQGENGSKPHD